MILKNNWKNKLDNQCPAFRMAMDESEDIEDTTKLTVFI